MNIFAIYRRYKVVKNFNKAIKKLRLKNELNWSYVPDIQNLFLSSGIIEIPVGWRLGIRPYHYDMRLKSSGVTEDLYEKIERFRDTVKITYKIWNDGNLKKPHYKLTLNFNLKKMPQINQSKFKKILEKLYSEEEYGIFFNNIIYFENFDKNVDTLLWSFEISKGKIYLLALLESLDYILTQSMIRYCHQVMKIKNLHITTDRMYDRYGMQDSYGNAKKLILTQGNIQEIINEIEKTDCEILYFTFDSELKSSYWLFRHLHNLAEKERFKFKILNDIPEITKTFYQGMMKILNNPGV